MAGPAPLPARSRRRLSVLRRAAHTVAARLAVWAIRWLWWTYRIEVVGHDRAAALIEAGRPLILTLWHDSVYVCGAYFQRLGGLGVRVTYLVSPSVDGELAVEVLRLVGARSVRGSASRSGVKAMSGLYRAIVRDGASPVVLPDGPHGPRRACKPGSLLLARLSGAAVLPLACAARRSCRLRTWDRAVVPLAFTRVVVAVGEPFTVPAGLGEGELEAASSRLGGVLNALEDEAGRTLARPGGQRSDGAA